MTKVKICGLMKEEDLEICIPMGIDMVGFVVDYPQWVPWNLTIPRGRELVAQVPDPVQTCVVTGGSVAKVLELAEAIKPNIIQLHHREDLAETEEISRRLKAIGIKTVKALRIDGEGNCNFSIKEPTRAVEALGQTHLWAVLVDAYTEARPGGTGKRVDLSLFRRIQDQSPLPVILAGGLNPNNITAIIHQTRPFAVDVLTGVEAPDGSKDGGKIAAFVQNVRNISQTTDF